MDRAEEVFTRLIESLCCARCNYLGINNLPPDQWKCTHEFAYSPSRDYPHGYEGDKDWFRIFVLENKDNSLSLPKNDINFSFVCPKFDDSKDGKPSEQYY